MGRSCGVEGGEETLPGPEGRRKGRLPGYQVQCEGRLLDCWRHEERPPGEEGDAERKLVGDPGGEVRILASEV